jgi:hypothetical protein
MIILVIIAIIAVAAPIAGALLVLLVSRESRREDAAHSLSRQPSGALQAATRRLLNFHSDGISRQPSGPGGTGARLARRPGGWLDGDDPFGADDEFGDTEADALHLARR